MYSQHTGRTCVPRSDLEQILTDQNKKDYRKRDKQNTFNFSRQIYSAHARIVCGIPVAFMFIEKEDDAKNKTHGQESKEPWRYESFCNKKDYSECQECKFENDFDVFHDFKDMN